MRAFLESVTIFCFYGFLLTLQYSCAAESMRQHRQASQEAQQRKIVLQRLAERKQGQRVLLDSSSQSDQSDFDASSGSNDFDERTPGLLLAPTAEVSRKSFKRLSQVRPTTGQQENARIENLPSTLNGSNNQRTPSTKPQHADTSSMADPDDLLHSFSSLSVSKPARLSVGPSSSFAAALTTQLPDELPVVSNSVVESDPKSAVGSITEVSRPEQTAQPEFRMKSAVESKLYKHQLEGVQWLWTLHKMRRGGILGQGLSASPLVTFAIQY